MTKPVKKIEITCKDILYTDCKSKLLVIVNIVGTAKRHPIFDQ